MLLLLQLLPCPAPSHKVCWCNPSKPCPGTALPHTWHACVSNNFSATPVSGAGWMPKGSAGGILPLLAAEPCMRKDSVKRGMASFYIVFAWDCGAQVCSLYLYKPNVHCVWLAGTESALGGSGMNRGVDPAGVKAETTAGSSSAQKLEKPQEVISFEAAKEVVQGFQQSFTEDSIICQEMCSLMSTAINQMMS